jgi:phosphate starvation-inducible protein PhoH and related proteins
LSDVEGITTVEFDKNDIVRHKLVRDIVEAYDRYNIIHNEDF